MKSYRRKFVNGRYGQMHLRICEPKKTEHPPLVCMHMFPQSGRNFELFVQAMGTDRTVIAPDFPGYGESDAPDQPITASEYAESIWDLVSELSLLKEYKQVDIFGIHAGAKLATELTSLHSDAVRKLILVSAAILHPEEVEQIKSALSYVALDAEGTRFINFWNMLLRNRGQETTLEMVAAHFAEMVRGGEKYSWGHRAVFDYNIEFPRKLAALPQPTLLLNPEDDLFEMTPRSEAFLQNGQLINLPGWGHGFLETKVNELAQITRNFLDNGDNQYTTNGSPGQIASAA